MQSLLPDKNFFLLYKFFTNFIFIYLYIYKYFNAKYACPLIYTILVCVVLKLVFILNLRTCHPLQISSITAFNIFIRQN